MDLIIAYIGFLQALIAVILILTKKPLRIAYIILCVLILVFAVMFGLDILQYYNIIPAKRTVISLCLTMLFAPLFYLYSKYITKNFDEFNQRDYLHVLPSLLLLFTFLFLKALPANSSVSFLSLFEKYNWIKISFGFLFQMLFVVYTISALRIVIRFKKQTKHYYSFNSYKISLNWLIAMIVLFFMIIALIIISSIVYETNNIYSDVIIFRHLTEVFYVYILGIWGFNQNQLNSGTETVSGNNDELMIEDSTSGKYQKSGLKGDVVKNHIQTLLLCMQDSEVWKDSELSISKLANQTSIPKYHISEVLNEHLGKSFYVFVNEYRIEYAKKLLMDKKYNNWSILAIAYECGFNSKAAFNSFFKKQTQLTPSEFKKSSTEHS